MSLGLTIPKEMSHKKKKTNSMNIPHYINMQNGFIYTRAVSVHLLSLEMLLKCVLEAGKGGGSGSRGVCVYDW